MHQADRKHFGIAAAETLREVVVDVSFGIAYAVNNRAMGIVFKYRHGLCLLEEAHRSCRVVQTCLPTVERIVVAVADERTYPSIVEPSQALHELELGAQAPIGRVVHVARDQQRVDVFVDAQVDDILVCAECRIPQRARHVVGCNGLYPDKRAIEMKISGMYKA